MLPIPGTSSVAHLEENVGAAAIRLDERRLSAALGNSVYRKESTG
jgi:aryl-alcohol dehydrogenase-like predicted oxidoreductase